MTKKTESFRHRVRRIRLLDPSLSATAITEKVIAETAHDYDTLLALFREVAPNTANEILRGMRRAAESAAAAAHAAATPTPTPAAEPEPTPAPAFTEPEPIPASPKTTSRRPVSMLVAAVTSLSAPDWWKVKGTATKVKLDGTDTLIPLAKARLRDLEYTMTDKRTQAMDLIIEADEIESMVKAMHDAGLSDPDAELEELSPEVIRAAVTAS